MRSTLVLVLALSAFGSYGCHSKEKHSSSSSTPAIDVEVGADLIVKDGTGYAERANLDKFLSMAHEKKGGSIEMVRLAKEHGTRLKSTPVKVISVDNEAVSVEVTSGEHQGKTLWVPSHVLAKP
ncbi:MAG: hypothetical protein U0271_10135 [Polyangiaceae bacterium]